LGFKYATHYDAGRINCQTWGKNQTVLAFGGVDVAVSGAGAPVRTPDPSLISYYEFYKY